MKIRSYLAIATALTAGALVSMPAFAQSKGFYGSLNVGGATVDDVDGSVYAPGGTFSGNDDCSECGEDLQQTAVPSAIPAGSDTAAGQIDLKSAFAISGSVGYDFGLIRTDVEFSYAENKVKSITIDSVNGEEIDLGSEGAGAVCDFLEASNCAGSGNTVSFTGYKLRQLNAMANVWIDIPTGTPIEPYLGGGIGISAFEIDGEADSSFAWQLGAGVAYHLTEKVAITADVRYRQADKAQFAYDEASGIELNKVKTWNYGLGLRYTF